MFETIDEPINEDIHMLDSTCLRNILSLDSDPLHVDIHDVIEELKNLSLALEEFREELEEDLCNVIGQNCDRTAMDYYNQLQQSGTTVVNM